MLQFAAVDEVEVDAFAGIQLGYGGLVVLPLLQVVEGPADFFYLELGVGQFDEAALGEGDGFVGRHVLPDGFCVLGGGEGECGLVLGELVVDFVLSAVVVGAGTVLDVLLLVFFYVGGVGEGVRLDGLGVVLMEVEELFVRCFNRDSDVMGSGYVSHGFFLDFIFNDRVS